MKKALVIFFCCVLAVVAVAIGGVYYAYAQISPVSPSNTTPYEFVITKGESISSIGQRLQAAGLIRQALLFRIVVAEEHLNNQIQAGSFSLSPSMSTVEIAHQLTRGTDDMKITVLEGWRKEEIAAMLADRGLPNFDEAEFLHLSKDEEGYLYPDTYFIQRSATTQSIHDTLRSMFDKKVATDLATDIAQSGHTLDEIVTMASLVQREAREPEQMKMISGILWNRVKLGMALDVDATLQYIKGYNKVEQSWWVEPLAIDKESTSPFNTYKYPGLPPQPIDNPGLDAIQAALHPTQSDYLYYVNDTHGGIHYAKTLEEHNRNVQLYLR